MKIIAQVLVAGLATVGLAAAAGPDRGDLIGLAGVHITEEGDTLIDLAQRHRVGYVELRAANPGVNPWVPGVGRKLVLPTAHLLPRVPRTGIVVNLGDLRLYYFTSDGNVKSYPIGIGQAVSPTPEGATRVVAKRIDPVWSPPPSIRRERPDLPAAIPPGPQNPLGSRAISLGFESYVIHGTNRPAGVGRRVSHGCIRMYEEDVRDLYDRVAVGTPVTIIREEVKLGWSDGQLYLEAHPPETIVDEIEGIGAIAPVPAADVRRRILDRIRGEGWRVDWKTVERAMRERTGLPVRITEDD